MPGFNDSPLFFYILGIKKRKKKTIIVSESPKKIFLQMQLTKNYESRFQVF